MGKAQRMSDHKRTQSKTRLVTGFAATLTRLSRLPPSAGPTCSSSSSSSADADDTLHASLVAAVGARIAVIVVAVGVAAVVADIVRWDLLATVQAAVDLLVVIPHLGLVWRALHNSVNPRLHLLVNVFISARVARCVLRHALVAARDPRHVDAG
jgi:hypothetical protein